ncbi:MAG: hypothetical protein PUA61_05060 [Succinatimonas hippei]|nr:hypothetical protein [Succinatimonas hippei]
MKYEVRLKAIMRKNHEQLFIIDRDTPSEAARAIYKKFTESDSDHWDFIDIDVRDPESHINVGRLAVNPFYSN